MASSTDERLGSIAFTPRTESTPTLGRHALRAVYPFMRDHGGACPRRLAIDAGVNASKLQRLEREGVVERPYRGVIALAGAPVDGWARLWRASFAVGPWALVDGRAAAWAHGFWLLGDLWPTIEIAVAHGCRRPAIPGVDVVRVRRLEAEWLPRRGGLPVASVDETLRQLGGVLSAKDLTGHVDEALRRRLTFVSWLRRFVAARPFDGTTGMAALRRVVGGDLTVTASEFERRLLAAFRAAGLPRPRVGAIVDGREADFWCRSGRRSARRTRPRGTPGRPTSATTSPSTGRGGPTGGG